MSYERRPHHKTAVDHRPDCGCHACRVWRRRRRFAHVLDNLSQAERRGVKMSREHYTETPEALQRRIERSEEIRRRILDVIDSIMVEEGWPPSVRRKAEDMFATEAARICKERHQDLPKVWGNGTWNSMRRGAISSLQVLLGHHAPFRNKKGRLQDAKGNADWVLDCWEIALAEWEGSRQMKLI